MRKNIKINEGRHLSDREGWTGEGTVVLVGKEEERGAAGKMTCREGLMEEEEAEKRSTLRC